jgi:hypothetical protein
VEILDTKQLAFGIIRLWNSAEGLISGRYLSTAHKWESREFP